MTEETSQEEIDRDKKWRTYLERTKGNPYSDISLKLLDMGLSLNIPKPLTPEILQQYYNAGVLRKEDLRKGEYYWGRCRNASLAMWEGTHFVYIRSKWPDFNPFLETINHIADDDGYDLFIPVKALTHVEDID